MPGDVPGDAPRDAPTEVLRDAPRDVPSGMPRDMVLPPALPAVVRGLTSATRDALLINPFYPKDPHASFGKHVLAPTLALTALAGATPPHWEVRYWDENLLQGT